MRRTATQLVKLLGCQNAELDTSEWRVLQCLEWGPACLIRLGVDEATLRVLEARGGKAFLETSEITFKWSSKNPEGEDAKGKQDDVAVWFTDGSQAKEGVEAGFCGPRQQDSFCFRMANYNMVFQAEVLVIKSFAEELTRADNTGKTIWICSDSQAALRATEKTITCFKLVMETKASLNALGMVNILNLTWISGHSG